LQGKEVVLDACDLGFPVTVHETACRAANLSPDDSDRALAVLKSRGVKIL
jgi:nicotinamidase-related amidase